MIVRMLGNCNKVCHQQSSTLLRASSSRGGRRVTVHCHAPSTFSSSSSVSSSPPPFPSSFQQFPKLWRPATTLRHSCDLSCTRTVTAHYHQSITWSSSDIRNRDLVMLGIETSCDDTGAAVVTGDGEILSEVVSSQAALLAQYGGVFPKMAQEGHAQSIDTVVAEALSQAHIKESDLTAVAVTIGPGLSLCLKVGVRKARTIARDWCLPLVHVHHMEAHALIARLTHKELQFPFLVLLVSGGHSLLLLAKNIGEYLQLGTTIDDAIGEAYDKTARMLGLDMTNGGGPAVEELAHEGDAAAINFNVPMRSHRDCNFSFAGLKTQVKLKIESEDIKVESVPLAKANNEDRQVRANIAASFQRVAVLHLEEKCSRAIEWAKSICPDVKELVVSGGVASNKLVRKKLADLSKMHGLSLVCPPPRLCTDNGVMVAWAGVEHFRLGRYEPPPPPDEAEDAYLDLRPRWQLGEIYAEGKSNARSLKTATKHPSLTAEVQRRLQSPVSDVITGSL